jgi:hypothetical protein
MFSTVFSFNLSISVSNCTVFPSDRPEMEVASTAREGCRLAISAGFWLATAWRNWDSKEGATSNRL